MFDRLRLALTLLSLLGSGLMAGLFFVFSNTAMTALGRIAPASGIAAMQSINRVILNPVFLTIFTGTALLCGLIVLATLLNWQQPGSSYLLIGSLCYIVGNFLVTAVFNVPMNNALDVVDPASAEGARYWAHYLSRWTAWNHVRTISCLAAMALLAIGLAFQFRGLSAP